MAKIINFIRYICSLLVIIITFLNIMNLVWIFYAKNIYWPLYSKIANVLEWVLLFSIFLLLPLLVLSNLRSYIRLVFFVVVAVTSCLEFGFINDVPVYLNSITVKDQTVILGQYGADNGTSCYQLLECKANSTYCKETKPNIYRCTGNFEANEMIIDKTGNLNVFINGILFYTYGDKSYSYRFSDLAIYNNFVYWAVHTPPHETPLFIFGRCDEKTRKSCEILQAHTNPEFRYMNLATDTEGYEMFMLFDGKLTHTFSNMSERFDILASVNTEHSLMNDSPSMYNVSVREEHGKYEYILYECNASYFWCEIHPFHYSTPSKEQAVLIVDEAKRELNLYINDKLIFTWNDHPVCDVGGCQILEK